jgi:hypothetical protein
MNITSQTSPRQWNEAMLRAHNYCTSIVRKGGTPVDAVKSYGIFRLEKEPRDWKKAEIIIALAMCKPGPLPN